MLRLLFILVFLPVLAAAQNDKVFMKDGKMKKGIVLSMGLNDIFFKTSDTSAITQKLQKKDILMVEKYDGKIYVFGNKTEIKDTGTSARKIYRNSIAVNPLSFLTGRLTGSYEWITKKGNVGVLFPLSLTFDPVGPIYSPKQDSTRPTSSNHISGINFITGVDVNFYLGKKRFFMGPRARYGVDVFLRNIEGYSLQTQFGWKLSNREGRLFHQLSFGFGFARILSSPAGNLISPKNSYGWGSVNYRVGFNW